MEYSRNTDVRLITRRGTVKWFNASKGYGFLTEDQTSDDFLLHRNTVLDCGRCSVSAGLRVTFLHRPSVNGLKVYKILDLKAQGDEFAASEVKPCSSAFVPVRVKWYDISKGYGFVNEFGSDEDVFVHGETLRSDGLSGLCAGDALAAYVGHNEMGKCVVSVRPWSGVEGVPG